MRFSVSIWVCIISLVAILFSGCAQQADLGLKFQQGEKCTYKVTQQSGKSYYFEQPAEDKIKEKNTDRKVEMVISQQVKEVTDNGAAVIDVTVDELKYYYKSPKGVQEDFDSTAKAKSSGKLANIIGKSYRVKINKNGKAEVIDNSAITKAAGGKFASWLFSRERIAERHSLDALPKGKTVLNTGDSWSQVVASPEGMLQSKAYEKVYTLEKVYQENGNRMGLVKMEAIPTSEEPEGGMDSQQKGAMGFFSKMFDSRDVYKGEMVVNLDTGQIKKYHEKLDANWVATDNSSGEKGQPDVLKMGYTDSFSIKQLER
jgi:hypothetical protein